MLKLDKLTKNAKSQTLSRSLPSRHSLCEKTSHFASPEHLQSTQDNALDPPPWHQFDDMFDIKQPKWHQGTTTISCNLCAIRAMRFEQSPCDPCTDGTLAHICIRMNTVFIVFEAGKLEMYTTL